MGSITIKDLPGPVPWEETSGPSVGDAAGAAVGPGGAAGALPSTPGAIRRRERILERRGIRNMLGRGQGGGLGRACWCRGGRGSGTLAGGAVAAAAALGPHAGAPGGADLRRGGRGGVTVRNNVKLWRMKNERGEKRKYE